MIVNYGKSTLTRPRIMDIVKLYGLAFKKIGGSIKACCPYHSDNKPSMAIYPSQDKFYCFVCQKHGDSLDLEAQLTGKTLSEVLRKHTSNEPTKKVTASPKPVLSPTGENLLNGLCRRLVAIHKAEDSLEDSPNYYNVDYRANLFYLKDEVEKYIYRLERYIERVRTANVHARISIFTLILKHRQPFSKKNNDAATLIAWVENYLEGRELPLLVPVKPYYKRDLIQKLELCKQDIAIINAEKEALINKILQGGIIKC